MNFRNTLIAVTLLASTALASNAVAQASAPVPAPVGATATQKAKIEKDAMGLSAEKAKMYNDTMKAAADANVPTRDEIRKAHEQADAILVADKFDKAAYLAKVAELDVLYNKTRTRMNDAFVGVVEKLSLEERKSLLKARNDNRRHQ